MQHKVLVMDEHFKKYNFGIFNTKEEAIELCERIHKRMLELHEKGNMRYRACKVEPVFTKEELIARDVARRKRNLANHLAKQQMKKGV